MRPAALYDQRWSRIACFSAIHVWFALSSNSIMAANEAEKAFQTVDGIKFVVTGSASSPIQACQSSECRPIVPPQAMLDSIKNGYSEIALVDLTMDGLPEIVLTHREEGSVNSCSEVYRYDENRNIVLMMDGLPNQLCNFTVKNGRIISSYRSEAKWHEDIFSIKDNSLIFEATDSCIGCDYINRTIYLPNGKTDHFLITGSREYEHRTPLTSVVVSLKAKLYSGPGSLHATKMYLIKGDRITLKDFTATEDNVFWYEISYIANKGKVITAWLRCNDAEVCDRSLSLPLTTPT